MAVWDMVGGDGLSNVKFMIWISGPVFSVCASMAREEFRDASPGPCLRMFAGGLNCVTLQRSHTLAVSLISARTKSHILRRILLTQLLFIYLPVTTQKSLLGWSDRAKNQLWCQFPAVTVSWQLPPSSIGTQIQIHRFMSALLSSL